MVSIFGKRDNVKAFWEWFATNRSQLIGPAEPDERFISKCGAQLKTIHEGLVFVVDLQQAPPCFVVSADGDPELFPIVKDVVAKAPRFDDVGIVAFRQPGPTDVAIQFGDQMLASASLWFETAPLDGGISLTVYVPGLSDSDDDPLAHAAFMLTDNALGEAFMALGLMDLSFVPLPPNPAERGLRPFTEIAKVFHVP